MRTTLRAFFTLFTVSLLCLPAHAQVLTLKLHTVWNERAMAAQQVITVLVDPHRYQQVITNLLSNAAKFSKPGSEVDVGVINLGQRQRVYVRDHGPGIPLSHRDLIFTKFHQGDASVTRAKGGTGLGLFISKQIVELMNGTIGFDTVVGEGTTFWIELQASQMSDVTSEVEMKLGAMLGAV